MRRLIALPVIASPLLLASSALAQAGDNGEGWAGETDDKVVTFFSLGVILFFVAFVVLTSIVQHKLEKRREEKREAAMRHRIGW